MQQEERTPPALDFSPQGLLAVLSQSDRPRMSGVTIDSAKTRVIDDGISVRRQGKGWVIEVSIADVPAMVPDGSALEDYARDLGYDRKRLDGEMERIFPREFLINHVSLKEGEERPAITFSIVLDEDLDVRNYGISRTMFRNERKYATDHVQERPGKLTPWMELGKRLYEKRVRKFSGICNDALAEGGNAAVNPDGGIHVPDPQEGNNLLVQEAMTLANYVATDFMTRNGIEAPYRPLRGIVDVDRVTRNLAFDRAVNKKAFDLIQQMEAQEKPTVRITSPMRNYEHFLGLKILANRLDGIDSPSALGEAAQGVVESFNQSASRKGSDLLSNGWSAEWRVRMTEQGKDIVREIERQRGSKTRTLKSLCQDHRMGPPDIAERRLKIGVLETTLVGISVGRGKGGGEQQTWAVHPDPEVALEMASGHMLNMLKKETPSI